MDPVFLHHDLSLVVPNMSSVHSGLYYCLLQHTEGIKIWPYELPVTHNPQKNQDHRNDHNSSRDTPRFRGKFDLRQRGRLAFEMQTLQELCLHQCCWHLCWASLLGLFPELIVIFVFLVFLIHQCLNVIFFSHLSDFFDWPCAYFLWPSLLICIIS